MPGQLGIRFFRKRGSIAPPEVEHGLFAAVLGQVTQNCPSALHVLLDATTLEQGEAEEQIRLGMIDFCSGLEEGVGELRIFLHAGAAMVKVAEADQGGSVFRVEFQRPGVILACGDRQVVGQVAVAAHVIGMGAFDRAQARINQCWRQISARQAALTGLNEVDCMLNVCPCVHRVGAGG